MKIEIKNRFNGNVIVSGDYDSIKIACEENKACLTGAILNGAILTEANLEGSKLEGADLRGAKLERAYLGGSNLGGSNIERANLGGSNLERTYLGGSNLEGSNLKGTNLEGAICYAQSHDIFIEICKRERKRFTEKDWAMIGVISVCYICWDEISKKFKHNIKRVFKKLSEAGFDEWEKYYDEFYNRKEQG